MDRYFSTGQSLQRTVAPTEEEEGEEKKKKEEEKKKKMTEPRLLYKENKLLASLATTIFSSKTMLCVKVVFV
jgi:hypothetical protein